jgi:hypothetical protein
MTESQRLLLRKITEPETVHMLNQPVQNRVSVLSLFPLKS